MFDSTMTVEHQVTAVCRSGYGQLQMIGHIRRYLSNEATNSLLNGLVTSSLDYYNAIFPIT